MKHMENNTTQIIASLPPNSFTFSLKDNEPIIVIDEEGFNYKGELIEDAGEVYRLFKEFLIKANTI